MLYGIRCERRNLLNARTNAANPILVNLVIGHQARQRIGKIRMPRNLSETSGQVLHEISVSSSHLSFNTGTPIQHMDDVLEIVTR